MAGRLPILTFHALDDADRSAIAFPPASFVRAVEALHRLGPWVLDMNDVASRLRNLAPFPPRALALTFDDGYRSVYEVAFPLLQRYGLKATVFLAVGRGRSSPDDALPSMNGRPMLRWREIRAMHRAGVTIGAHTLTHPDLSRLPLDQVREEIRESKARIEDVLNAPVTCFAYPYGAADRPSRQAVAEHFGCACSDRLGLVTSRSDRYALPRVDAYYLRAVPLFNMIFTELFSWYLRTRNLPRLARRWLRDAASHNTPRSLSDEGRRSQEEVIHGR